MIAYFRPLDSPAKLVPAMVSRAEASLALGDDAAAEADLDSAAARYDARLRSIASAPVRAALLSQARSVFDGLVMLHLRAGREQRALDDVERRRVSFAPGTARSRNASEREASSTVANGVAVDYALIGDTLLAWVVDSGGATLVRSSLDRAALGATVARARAALELRARDEVARPELARLYDLLVRPIEARLGDGERRLSIVADAEISDVPFAALYDARRRQFLIERHAIRHAQSLLEARTVLPSLPEPGSRGIALFIANPTLDRAIHPALAPLPSADAEVRAAAAVYADATVMTGAAADSARVSDAMERAGLFHFAGHAVLDDARPERSFLAVAPRGLSAAALAQLDLHRMRLAVLSSCETTRGSGARTGGFAGVAEAFIAAGAGGVIGSSWRVEDDRTAALMREFHGAYRGSGDAAAALRVAQMALLRSGSATLRSPAAWGAFRYQGR